MPVKTENEVSIIGSDRIEGGILLHFSEGTSVLYHAHMLTKFRLGHPRTAERTGLQAD